jgi:PhnB protein
MASRLNPYVTFDGNAREAMEFYRDVLGGDLTLSTFGELGMAGGPEEHQIMHGQLETGAGFTLMGADVPPGAEHRPGTAITISLSGDDEELRTWFERLAEGGEVVVPLEKQMWGDEYGQLVDRFGVPWMVNIGTGSDG